MIQYEQRHKENWSIKTTILPHCKKPDLIACEQRRHILTPASMPSDQGICYSLCEYTILPHAKCYVLGSLCS